MVVTENSVLRQGAVADNILCLVGIEMIEWDVGHAVSLLVMQHMMSVTERSSLDILPWQPDMDAILQQWAECQSFTDGPVGLTVWFHLTALLQDPFYAWPAHDKADYRSKNHVACLINYSQIITIIIVIKHNKSKWRKKKVSRMQHKTAW